MGRDNITIYDQNIGVDLSQIIVCPLAKIVLRSKSLFITEIVVGRCRSDLTVLRQSLKQIL